MELAGMLDTETELGVAVFGGGGLGVAVFGGGGLGLAVLEPGVAILPES